MVEIVNVLALSDNYDKLVKEYRGGPKNVTTYCNNRPFARLVRVPQPRSQGLSSYRFLTRSRGR